MNAKAEAAVKGIKDLGGEVNAWEGRVHFLQVEYENLKRKNEQVKAEIESSLTLAKQELDKNRAINSQETLKMNEMRAKLEADKTEFQNILNAFNKERRDFEGERDKMIDRDNDTKKLNEKLSNFMLYVKREAAAL